MYPLIFGVSNDRSLGWEMAVRRILAPLRHDAATDAMRSRLNPLRGASDGMPSDVPEAAHDAPPAFPDHRAPDRDRAVAAHDASSPPASHVR